MKKVIVTSSIDRKKEDQRLEEMHMTLSERWDLAFQRIELAQALSPNGKFSPPADDSIEWIELKLKDGQDK
jgi:hypothetical protein